MSVNTEEKKSVMSLKAILLTVTASVIGTLFATSPWEQAPVTLGAQAQSTPAVPPVVPSPLVGKPSSNLKRQVVALTERLAATETQLAVLHELVEAQGNVNATPQVGSKMVATPVEPVVVAATTTHLEPQPHQSSGQKLERVTGQLLTESRDEDWANSIENGLTQTSAHTLAQNMQISGIDCRATLCQASIAIDANATMLLPHMLSSTGASETMIFNTTTPGQYQVVFKR